MNVLVISSGYLPNFKFGGPVRTLSAVVEQLGEDINFSIVAKAVDLGETEPYQGVDVDAWTRVGNARVWYMSSPKYSPAFWREIIAHTRPDVIYLNSIMSPISSSILFWRKFRILPPIPVVLAPRGELAASALAIKTQKKSRFLRLAKHLRLHKGLLWQASSEAEASDIQRTIGTSTNIHVAPDLVSSPQSQEKSRTKQVGFANMCWLGRVAPVKNLAGGLKILHEVKSGQLLFATYGPIEAIEYWNEVQKVADNLPDQVLFEHHGPLSHSQVEPALRQHQFFFFPTLGENFGHVIAEALSQGLPVIVSDQTPWRGLEAAGVGWDIPLNDTKRWLEVVEHCIRMDNEEYQAMSARCRGYVDIWMEEHGGRQANLDMFEKAVGHSTRR